MRTAIQSLSEVDLICHLVDAAHCVRAFEEQGDPIHGDEAFVFGKLERVDTPRFLVVNKIDLVSPKERMLPVIEALIERGDYAEVVPVSALTGDNVDTLVDVMLEQLPEHPPLFPEDMITDRAERFLAAEFVREQIMLETRREIPYSVAVEVESFEDVPGKDLVRISAIIHVERNSQKGIVIGKGGKRLKRIGAKAREQMEQLFGRQVYLETFVRVQQGWSEDPRSLGRFGYEET